MFNHCGLFEVRWLPKSQFGVGLIVDIYHGLSDLVGATSYAEAKVPELVGMLVE